MLVSEQIESESILKFEEHTKELFQNGAYEKQYSIIPPLLPQLKNP